MVNKKSIDKEKSKKTKDITWLHLYLYSRIKERAKIDNLIRPSIIIEEFKKILRIPNTLHYPILNQMEEEGLIKRINHQKYELTDEEKNSKIKEINKKLKDLAILQYGRRNRMLKAMEECELIKKDKNTKFRILESDCEKKIKSMGNYTFW